MRIKFIWRLQPLFTLLNLIFLAFVIPSQMLRAQWSTDPNTNTAVCTASGAQAYPQIVSDGNGGAIMVWQDKRNGTDYDIYAQRFNASGVAQWSANGIVICSAIGNQQNPKVSSDGTGGAIVVWEDYRSGVMADIYTQRINHGGSPLWSSGGVGLCTATGGQSLTIGNSVISADGSGGAIIVWADYRSGNSDVFCQKIHSSGVPVWTTNGISVCSASLNQFNPVIVSDGSGGVIIGWDDKRNGTDENIYVQRISPAGSALWGLDGISICSEPGSQTLPVIVSDGSGGAIIGWHDKRASSTNDIFAQRINGSGNPLWMPTGYPVCTAAAEQSSLRMISDGASGAILTWVDARNSSSTGYDIYAQKMIAGGSPGGWNLNGVAVTTAPGNQSVPSILEDGSGGAFIAWADNPSGSNSEISAQWINSSGVREWESNGTTVSSALNYQFYPNIVKSTDGVIIVWEDNRNSSTSKDIYAQYVYPSGKLHPPEPTTSWQQVFPFPTGIDLYGVYAIPSTDTVIAVGGNGQFIRSTDGGYNWRVTYHAAGDTNAIRSITFFDKNIGIAVGDFGSILRTTDAGWSWVSRSKYLTGNANGKNFYSVSFMPNGDAVAVGDSGYIARSTNNGLDWYTVFKCTTPVLLTVSFGDNSVGMAAGINESDGPAHCFRTIDGGVTWTQVSNFGVGAGTRLLSIHFVSGPDTIVVGSNGASQYYSPDSGNSWFHVPISVSPPGGKIIGYHIFSMDVKDFKTRICGGGIGGGQFIFRTSDAATTWDFAEPVKRVQNFYGITYLRPTNRVIAVGNGGVIVLSSDGGESWISISDSTSTSAFRGLSFPDSSRGFVVGDNGKILRTDDAGKSWVDIENPFSDADTNNPSLGAYYGLRRTHFVNRDSGIVLGDHGRVFRTTNGGDSWVERNIGTFGIAYGLHVPNMDTMIVAGSGGEGVQWFQIRPNVARTTNGGLTWTSQHTYFGTNRGHFFDLYFWDQNNGIMCGDTGYYPTFTPIIMKTTDGGLTWVNSLVGPAGGLPATGTLRSIRFVNSTDGIAVGMRGEWPNAIPSVFKTTDGGSTWNITANPYESASFNSAFERIVFINSDTGIVVGSSRFDWAIHNTDLVPVLGHMIMTTDRGDHWEIQKTNASYLADIQFFYKPSFGYAGIAVGSGIHCAATFTESEKVWKGTVSTDWHNPTNWDPLGVPLNFENVVVRTTVSSRYPVIANPCFQVTVGSLQIDPGTSLTVTSDVKQIVVLGDFFNAGSIVIPSGENTNFVYGGTVIGAPGGSAGVLKKYSLSTVRSTPLVSGMATSILSGTGEVTGRFHRLVVDLNSEMTSAGHIVVEQECNILRDFNLEPDDTLEITNGRGTSLSGLGTIQRGTIKRSIEQSSTEPYRFESPHTYVQFANTGTYPTSVSMRVRPGESPRAFTLRWKVMPSELNQATKTLKAVGVDKLKTKFAIGKGITAGSLPKSAGVAQVSSMGTPMVRRMYEVSQSGGAGFIADVSLRYNESELDLVNGGPNLEDSLVMLEGPYVAEMVQTRWNLVSLPVGAESCLKTVLFPNAVSNAYSFDNGYHEEDTLVSGKSYWLKFGAPEEIEMKGMEKEMEIIDLHEGWNLIGALSFPVEVSTIVSNPPDIVTSSFYTYGGGYSAVSTLEPMGGYWVKASTSGQIHLDANVVAANQFLKSTSMEFGNLHSLNISDAEGNKQILFFSLGRPVDARKFEAPPVPPEGGFDVRFATQRMAEFSTDHSPTSVPVQITGATYPIKITWDVREADALLKIDGKEVRFEGNGQITITNQASQIVLVLSPALMGKEAPTVFALAQNYPNPFNPRTVIRYQLPVASHVTLKIYDVVGREVKTLVNGMRDAGYESVEWDAGSVASGMYFYRLEAVSSSDPAKMFSRTLKMLVVK
jgi:photosystem II stability/assembly factor-like uncharacterized protein